MCVIKVIEIESYFFLSGIRTYKKNLHREATFA